MSCYMTHISYTAAPPVIDCTQKPDMLTGWPVADLVRASTTAMAIMADLEGNWTLKADDLDGQGWAIDTDEHTITIDTAGLSKGAIIRSHYFQNTCALWTFAGLRAAWLSSRIDTARESYRPDLWMLLGRVAAADVAAMTLRMAFDTRDVGHDSLWRHALGDANGDMAAAYARALEYAPYARTDHTGLAIAFRQWFAKDTRLIVADADTLADMDANLADLTMEGAGHLGLNTLRCLTLDPASGVSYLGHLAADIAGDPAWRTIADPVTEAHLLQVMDDIGTIRIGNLAVRDKKLAARLFPEMLVRA